ncbi:MAG: glycosyl transferase group 1 [Mucilaginibacter sp.]|uniref:glycosyltransferase n=1 Tax=Mucilaginibacter sp. TaxID=1882438 RepID=UPI00262160F6|nr:glycosyltransferase [Mucilaginibacter sp.]MDB5002311.1 glycosyl transferase group 1 [Mucilaginibacter sp.]
MSIMDTSKNRKKGLIVIPRMPYPLNSGGRIAIYDSLEQLSQKYELVIIIIDDDRNNQQYLNHLSRFSNSVHFCSFNKCHFFFNTLLGLVKGKPLQVGYFYFRKVQKIINESSLSCDFFVSFMIRTSSYGLNLQMPKYHYAIDSMYLNYKNSKENAKSIIWKLIYSIETPLLFNIEKKHVRNFNLTTFVNKNEAEFWKEYGNVANLPHGVEASIFERDKTDSLYKDVVAFIGRMDYQPNIDAVLWFCDNVLGSLNYNIQFWIIGGHVSDNLRKKLEAFKNVKIVGFVDDPYIILRSCLCTVAPMQTGGGLQTKILMAMAVESLVLTTSSSASAIENAKDGVNIIVENSAYRYVEVINDIYKNPSKYLSIKQEAKTTILNTYSLDIIKKKLLSLLGKYLNI